MNTSFPAVAQRFSEWADRGLAQPIPQSTVAFHFNLYEGETSVHVQLMGTESFDPGDDPETDYWPGKKTFSTGEAVFEIPYSTAGADWQEWLKTSKQLVSQYLSDGAKSGVLKASKGVGIGFVDGDMHVLWQAGDA